LLTVATQKSNKANWQNKLESQFYIFVWTKLLGNKTDIVILILMPFWGVAGYSYGFDALPEPGNIAL